MAKKFNFTSNRSIFKKRKAIAHTESDRRYTGANRINNGRNGNPFMCRNNTVISASEHHPTRSIIVRCGCGHSSVFTVGGCFTHIDALSRFYDTHPN